MWHFISEHISEVTQSLFVCQHRSEIQGGDTHRSYVLRDENRRFFVKICSEQGKQLACEAQGLGALASSGTLLTPAVICHGHTEESAGQCAYLVLAFIKFIDGDEQNWFALGQQLAHLHHQSQGQRYGWEGDNFIGKSVQKNQWEDNWATFFAEHRIGFMLEHLAHHNQRLVNIDAFVNRVAGLLKSHHPAPALLHGDLWSGNAGFCKRGPMVFDPATYIGDRETDLAMTELFGAFPKAFYQGYDAAYPIADDYQQRKQLYQLYHLLNHALIFGGHYLRSCKSAIISLQKLN